MSFSHLGLSEKVLKAVTAAGYTTPTPIQDQAIPHVLARRDIVGIALGSTSGVVVGSISGVGEGMGTSSGVSIVPLFVCNIPPESIASSTR